MLLNWEKCRNEKGDAVETDSLHIHSVLCILSILSVLSVLSTVLRTLYKEMRWKGREEGNDQSQESLFPLFHMFSGVKVSPELSVKEGKKKEKKKVQVGKEWRMRERREEKWNPSWKWGDDRRKDRREKGKETKVGYQLCILSNAALSDVSPQNTHISTDKEGKNKPDRDRG